MMKTIKIFLASSAELDSEKDQVDLFIARKNKDYQKKGLFLELSTWKDFVSAMTEDRTQELYNNYIRSCDIAVFLFHTRLGRYTREEFDVAHHSFKTSANKPKKPLIYTYFRSDLNEAEEITSFKMYVDSLDHFFDTYSSTEDLLVKLNRQLDKLENEGVIKPNPLPDSRNILKYLVYYFIIPLMVLGGAVTSFLYFTPANMTVKIREMNPVPGLPFKTGSVSITYGDKTETFPITDEITFRQIPSKFKHKPVKLIFISPGFVTIDTIVDLKEHTDLHIKRDNSLGLVFGWVRDENGKPLNDVNISLKSLTSQTDVNGNFRIEIPSEQQSDTIRLTAYKEGYKTWYCTGAPSRTTEWRIMLQK